jgi:hypothetical protein
MGQAMAMMWRSKAAAAFLVLAGLLVGLKLLFEYYPGDFPLRDQASAFDWLTIGSILLLAALGFLADRSIGFPEPFADAARERLGFLIALGLGAAYGVLTVALDVALADNHPLSAGGSDHVALPWSIPFYLFGAIFLEFFLRLGALCILVWFVHVLILRRRFKLVVFWIAACIVAAYEILPYVMDDVAARRWTEVALAPLQPLYWTNVLEAGLLLRFGWIAPIVFRVGFYLVWHILWGGLGPASAAGAVAL